MRAQRRAEGGEGFKSGDKGGGGVPLRAYDTQSMTRWPYRSQRVQAVFG